MDGAIILDTETTGIDEPDVIELAWLPLVTTFGSAPTSVMLPGIGPMFAAGGGGQSRYRPRKPITTGAMASHHIIPADLAGCPEWPGSWSLPPFTTYLIGHNIDYDWKAIGTPPVKRICTLAIARRLWPQTDSHSLGALIYHLIPHAEARDMLRGVHSACVDALNTHRVLLAELAMMPAICSWERLWAASERARVPVVFDFGKYGPQDGKPGTPIAEVRQMDPGYVDWCLTKCDRVKDDPYWQRALRGEA